MLMKTFLSVIFECMMFQNVLTTRAVGIEQIDRNAKARNPLLVKVLKQKHVSHKKVCLKFTGTIFWGSKFIVSCRVHEEWYLLPYLHEEYTTTSSKTGNVLSHTLFVSSCKKDKGQCMCVYVFVCLLVGVFDSWTGRWMKVRKQPLRLTRSSSCINWLDLLFLLLCHCCTRKEEWTNDGTFHWYKR